MKKCPSLRRKLFFWKKSTYLWKNILKNSASLWKNIWKKSKSIWKTPRLFEKIFKKIQVPVKKSSSLWKNSRPFERFFLKKFTSLWKQNFFLKNWRLFDRIFFLKKIHVPLKNIKKMQVFLKIYVSSKKSTSLWRKKIEKRSLKS